MALVEVNGVKLNVESEGNGPSLVLLHGFTGCAASWEKQVAAFSPSYRTIAIEALGHGHSDSPTDPERYGFSHLAADYSAVLDRLGLDKVALLGYSMGGRMALQLAVALPERISVLILESASPGLESRTERALRIGSDNQIAEMIDRDGLAAFVDYWEKAPIFASQKGLPWEVLHKQRQERLSNNPLGLSNSLRGAGTGRMPPLHAELPKLKMPVLLLAGQYDDKYLALNRVMVEAIPGSRLKVMGGAGHSVHLERPGEYNRVVLEFLNEVYPAGK